MTHFSQQPSRLEASAEASGGVLHVRGGGFVTELMVEEAFARLLEDGGAANRLLIDVRDVAGYDSQAVRSAHSMLARAPAYGVRRIAFVASSAVVRSATELASSQTGVRLQAFQDESHARDWLGG